MKILRIAGSSRRANFYFLSYCVGKYGVSIEEHIGGAFDDMERRLKFFGLSLENVVQMDCLFRDVWKSPLWRKSSRRDFMENIPFASPFKPILQTEAAKTGCNSKWTLSHIRENK